MLFSSGSGPVTLKYHFAKLLSGDGDPIRDPKGDPVDFGSVPLGDGGGGDGSLNYDQLHQILEGLLCERGYYVASTQLLEQLPPSRI